MAVLAERELTEKGENTNGREPDLHSGMLPQDCDFVLRSAGLWPAFWRASSPAHRAAGTVGLLNQLTTKDTKEHEGKS